PAFAGGNYDTGFLERSGILSRIAPYTPPSPADEPNGAIVVEVNGPPYRVVFPDGALSVASSGAPARPRAGVGRRSSGAVVTATGNTLTSPIQGTVLSVAVEPGATVEAGQLICVIEAMKMEN